MSKLSTHEESIFRRAQSIAEAGSLEVALKENHFDAVINSSFAEGLVLGLLKQGVKKYLCIFGHGSTELGNVLRLYQKAGVVQCYNFRNEVAMAHTGSALRWIYDEPCAVVTSIGPGALQAFAGALMSASNGIGLYHIYGDETTHGEGYNMQQVPRNEQGVFQKMMSLMGTSYQLHTPGALRDALRAGSQQVFHPTKAGPCFLLFPINTQPALTKTNVKALPERPAYPALLPHDELPFKQAAAMIQRHGKVVIKAGGGTRHFSSLLTQFAEVIGAPVVLSPGSTGVIPDHHKLNMHVGGSKGSISGNYAMENATLLIVIGSRAVCQSDCSGVGYPNATEVININADENDIQHYNHTKALQGDIGAVLGKLIQHLKTLSPDHELKKQKSAWQQECLKAKSRWSSFKQQQYELGCQHDPMWQCSVMTQPLAIKVVADFARTVNAVKLFDAGDVQANGFQVVEDDQPFTTFTDTGASYMGFASSAVVASGLADHPKYPIAFTGDGSFMMNPQVLIDAIEHTTHGMVVIFDNRRMAAISSLQHAQYEAEFITSDEVAVDYVQMASSVEGVAAFDGGTEPETLKKALQAGYTHKGLSVVVVPVYYEHTSVNGLGAHGSWNVGNWVGDVQKQYHKQII